VKFTGSCSLTLTIILSLTLSLHLNLTLTFITWDPDPINLILAGLSMEHVEKGKIRKRVTLNTASDLSGY